MAYGNIFPATYPMYQPQPQQMYQPQPQQQAQGGLNWVSGETGAKSFQVAPNTTVTLWDSESQTIYLKSADASGMPTMKILDYTIREQQGQNMPTLMQDSSPNYITRDDLSEFEERLKKIFVIRKHKENSNEQTV